MPRINVLSPGFTTPNGRAFLFPLIVWQRKLRDLGYQIRIYRHITGEITQCDALLVDSKYHRSLWRSEPKSVLEELHSLAARCYVVFCDTSDSAGFLLRDVLPVVHVYAKSQALIDRSDYSIPFYGLRAFSDFYHRKHGIEDLNPERSAPVRDPALLKKIRVSWNSGLGDYSLRGPSRMATYRYFPAPALLRFSTEFTKPSEPRTIPVSVRFGVNYPRESVAMQRKLISRKLTGQFDTTKVSRSKYYRELKQSRIVISPFGYGEITLKDFEVFLTGGILVKPNMGNVQTWPDFFKPEETILVHRWDLSDLNGVIERTLAQYDELRRVAEAGQECYRSHTVAPDAPRLFADQLSRLIAPAELM